MASPVGNTPEAAEPAAPGKTAGGGGGGPGEIDMNMTASTMQELEAKAPEVVEAMKRGIAQQIVASMRRAQERLKRLMREGRRG